LKAAMSFRLAKSGLTSDDLEGSKTKITVFDVKSVENRKSTMLDPMNMPLGHTENSSLDLSPDIFGLLVSTSVAYQIPLVQPRRLVVSFNMSR